MSLLEEIYIQGIRSFGPENPQRIKFSAPLTLILGPNGTGKTTIIECLKYAVTGELPPGGKTGASFIHDPKLAHSVEVKAKVALKLRDVKNSPLVVARSLVATQRGPMLISLGTSRAVFDNVIFCHQEESNWPLHEAKAVKERFDNLFASSQYVKALDAIRRFKLEEEANAKIYRGELKHLSRSREEAIQIKSQRIDTERALNDQKRVLSKVDEDLDPINTKLTLYRTKYKELVQHQADARGCVAEISRLEAMRQDLVKHISAEFQGTDEELKNAVERAEEHLAEKHLSFAAAEQDLHRLKALINTNEQARSDLIIQRTQLDIEVKQQEEALRKRDEILEKLCVDLGIQEVTKKTTSAENMAATDVETVQKHLEAALRMAESQMDRRAQTIIDEARSALIRVEQSIASQKTALADNIKEVADVELKLRQASSAGGELERIRKKLAEAVKTREMLESSRDEAQLRKSIEEAQAELISCEDIITGIDNQIVEAQKSAMANHERSMLETSRKAAIETAKKIRNRSLDLLEQIFAGEPIPPACVDGGQTLNSLTKAFNKRLDELVHSSRATQESLTALQRNLSKLETEMSFKRKRLHEKEDALRVIEERLISVCGGVELQKKLDNLVPRKEQLKHDCEIEEGSLHLWKKFRDRLIEKRIVTTARDLNAKRKDLLQIDAQYEAFIELKPCINELAELQKTELPELRAEVQATQSSLEKLQNEIANEASKLEGLQSDESVARMLQGDMTSLENTEKEIVNLSRSLASLTPVNENTTFPKSKSSSNLLSTAVIDFRKKLDQELAKRQKATNEENELRSTLLKARSYLIHTSLRQFDPSILEKEFQSATSLNVELERLMAAKTRITGKLEDLSSQLPSCKAALLAAENAKQKVAKEASEKMMIASAEWQEWRDRSRQVKEACEVVALKTKDGEGSRDHLKRVTEELAKLDANTEGLKSALATTSKSVEDLHAEIANHKIVQRELGDCVRLRETRSQLSLLKERFQDIQRQIDVCQFGPSEPTDLEQHINTLSNEEERLRSQKQAIKDKITQLQTELRMLERSLVEKYGDAETEYMKKIYDLRTTEILVTDLERYHQALDRAINAYHVEKVNEVNKIVRELWRTTYRGNDIDHIKICSEEESSVANVNATRTRRTYNYRVVMVKAASGPVLTGGGKQARWSSTETQLDMRGRCSAGQKVLASLVIRLALAEVFCLQCGVLALDEPTTNLDRENIESLAYALNEIIKTRSSQRNFQLIIITHDEDFIELLGRAGCAAHLQRLVRNLEGLSEVQKVRIEDQFR
ncbi:unnamed protein product [Hydatigera taeniaeformis]|uniref:AAA_23 domain-containing protein n=1 Tax=Hydatigena taeniaeformis TaxID=6205 RepID=A0A158RDX2_HYDTA|nr:unnamed protein product [Hydatigera taeniaeformis]